MKFVLNLDCDKFGSFIVPMGIINIVLGDEMEMSTIYDFRGDRIECCLSTVAIKRIEFVLSMCVTY